MAKKLLNPNTLLNPTPVVMASCKVPGKPPNLITLAWVGVACSSPPILSIAVRPSRYSYDLIKDSGEFVIVVPNEAMVEAVDYCGVVSGRKVDKFAETGLRAIPAIHVQAPLVEQAPINLECKVVQMIELGVHHLFLGEILAVHVDEEILTDKDGIDTEKSLPIAYCYGSKEYRGLGKLLGTNGFSVKKKKVP